MNYKLIGQSINFVSRLSPSLAQKISFKLFTSPRPRKQKPEEIEFLKTANQETVHSGGQKIQVYSWGQSDKKILFSHGWESNAGRWRSFIPPLVKKGFQVIAFDAPGHGASEGHRLHLVIFMQAIKAIMDKFGAFYATVGHSMGGGATVMALHDLHLPRPKKLVLLATFSEVSKIYDSYSEMLGLAPKLKDGFDKTIKKLSGQTMAHFSIVAKAALLSDVQGLIIHDKQDQTIPISEARDIAQNWPTAKLIETDGAGHSLQNDFIFTQVVDFLSRPDV